MAAASRCQVGRAEFIPLVGLGANALKIFNQQNETSYILDSGFRKLLSWSGDRPFGGGWRVQHGVRPGRINDLVDGSSLLGP